MRVAFLSDVHANFPALWRALEGARRHGAEAVVCAGDLVGFGPHPVEVVRLLVEGRVSCIRGNVERKLLGLPSSAKRLKKRLEKRSSAALAWTALALGGEERRFLEALPERLDLTFEGCPVLVVHGSPLSDTDYIYPSLTRRALESKLGPLRPGVLVCGHSHVPFTRAVGGIRVVNCGSVGKPVDGDPRGSYALVDFFRGAPARARIVRFSYPVESVVRDIAERRAAAAPPEDFLSGRKNADG
jgi:putative phosphoesterase